MRHNVFHLVTLGRLTLVGPDGREEESLSRRKRKLALLAVLALSSRPVARHLLIEMFWGDQEEERAKHSLSDALSHARRILGREAISSRQSEVSLMPNAPLAVDAANLANAARAGDAERVVQEYTGPFFDGVYLGGSAAFEHWVAGERRSLERLFHEACERHGRALLAAGDAAACVAIAERWLSSAPLSADAALVLLDALRAPGTREADARAYAAFEGLASRVRRDFDLALDAKVRAAGDAIAARLHGGDAPPPAPLGSETAAEPQGAVADAAPTVSPPSPAEQGPAPDTPPHATRPSNGARAPRRVRTRWVVVAAGALAIALLLSRGSARHVDAHSSAAPRSAVAVATMTVRPNDTTSTWLGDGVPRLIDAELSRGAAVRVASPADVRAAEHGLDSAHDWAVALGRQLGAAWVVTGAVTTGDSAYVLDVTVHDVASGTALGPYTVSAGSLAALSDAAASRILKTTLMRPTAGPRLAGVRTTSVAAYRAYVRAVQDGEEGRLVDQRHDLDVAIALDSGFVSALALRLETNVRPDTGRLRSTVLELHAFPGRASHWDRLTEAAEAAYHAGESPRADSLARDLVARFPRDPRAYGLLADFLTMHGDWAGADAVYQRELQLDAVGADAGGAPCAPCVAYFGLVSERTIDGNLSGAEAAARQWLALQPDLPAAWTSLSFVLQTRRRYAAALTAAHHAQALSPSDATYGERIGRLLIIDHRYEAADSLITLWRRSTSAPRRLSALDLEATLQRERGQMRASVRTIDTLLREFPDEHAMQLVRATSMAAIGEFAGAERVFEHEAHLRAGGAPHGDLAWALGDKARHAAWEHALEADALAAHADTARLRALADTIAAAGAHSYYARDRRLAHHVLGLIAMRGGRYRDAVNELERGRWGASGWTATLATLARASLALGQPRAAIGYLSHAYEAPLDAMGRYVPRTEIDYLMALSYHQAGMADSSAAYVALVRAAWRDADPEVKAQLAALARSAGSAR